MDPLPIIDHASAASDRWLFLGTLLVTGIGYAWFVRWLISFHTGMMEKLSAIVQSNTEALGSNTRSLNATTEAIKNCPHHDR